MGFFSFDFKHAKGQIQVSDQCWIWFVCAVPLTALTLGLSYLWVSLKDPIRQNHASSPGGYRVISWKPTSRKPAISSIETEDIGKMIEEQGAVLKEGEKRKCQN